MQAGKERRKLSCHPTSPHRPAGTGFGETPGPRVFLPSRGPTGSRPRSPPPRARRAHSLTTRNRNWAVGGTRAMASGRGQVGGRRHAASTLFGRTAGWLARVSLGARGARGRQLALPSRRRTSRAAAEGALPAPARSRASFIAGHPPLEESQRGDG